ncbi:uncharacterized protein [Patagioenas fasciata]|uniref:uncharacterized protein n=1 Tax=Patagioenas fasciata TaxID=372321 RepID=UPI003A98FBB8
MQIPQGVLLPHGVQLLNGVQPMQLSHGVQLPFVPAPCPPYYTWGQQVITGTLVPNQPMGLEPLAMVQGQPLYPTGSYQLPVPACPGSPPRHDRAAQWVQGPPVPRTLPSSAQEPGEASNKDRVAIEENIPAASPHQSPLAPSACTTTMEPTAPVPTPAALERLVDQPKQEPEKASVKAAEQVEDTTINDLLTWLDTLEHEDAVPDVPDSPGLTTFLSELPDLSEYVAEGGCAKQRVVAVGLGDSEDAIPDVPDTPNLTTCLNNFPISPSTGQRTPAPQSQWRWRGWRTARS